MRDQVLYIITAQCVRKSVCDFPLQLHVLWVRLTYLTHSKQKVHESEYIKSKA